MTICRIIPQHSGQDFAVASCEKEAESSPKRQKRGSVASRDIEDILEHGENGDRDEHATNGEGKGYSASNKLTATQGAGYVALVYFVVNEGDCENIKVRW